MRQAAARVLVRRRRRLIGGSSVLIDGRCCLNVRLIGPAYRAGRIQRARHDAADASAGARAWQEIVRMRILGVRVRVLGVVVAVLDVRVRGDHRGVERDRLRAARLAQRIELGLRRIYANADPARSEYFPRPTEGIVGIGRIGELNDNADRVEGIKPTRPAFLRQSREYAVERIGHAEIITAPAAE